MRALVALALCLILVTGCVAPRYRMPAIVGSAGAALSAGGAATLVALADDRSGRLAAVSVMAVGVAALLAAAIWLGVSIRCETALDCPEGDACQPVPTPSGQSYGVCVPGERP